MEPRFCHVKQENASGCGPACVAILTGATYKHAKETMWGDRTRNLYSEYHHLRTTLTKLKAWPAPRAVRSTSFERVRELSIFACKLRKGRDGKNKFHWVVYDPHTGHIYDPLRAAPLPLTKRREEQYKPFSRLSVRLPNGHFVTAPPANSGT
jgi:hypothetical protein